MGKGVRARDLQPLASVELRKLSAEVSLSIRPEAPRRDGIDRGLCGQARARGPRAPLQGGAAEPLPLARARAAPVPRAVGGALQAGDGAHRARGERTRGLPRERRALPHQLLPPALPVRSGRDARARAAGHLLARCERRLSRAGCDRPRRARARRAAHARDPRFQDREVGAESEGARSRSPARALPDRDRRKVRCGPADPPRVALPVARSGAHLDAHARGARRAARSRRSS